MTNKPTPVCETDLPEGSRIVLAEHGTLTRYNQMFRLGVPRCDACKIANTQRDIANRAKRRGEKAETPDFDAMKVAELKQHCRDNGISGYDGLKRADLVALIQASA